MENLQLILVTVLITLLSVAVVGSIAYLVAVVRKLKRVVKDNTVDVTNLQQSLQFEVTELHNRINNSNDELDNRLRDFDNTVSNMYNELDRKIDSRCDKLYDGYNKEVQQVYLELQKRDESEHLR
jgi:hypothetical protein